MALPKLFQRIFWHNNTTPAINEDNLNAMSKGLSDVDDRLIELAGTIMEDVPEIQHDLEILEPAIENIDANVERSETAADNAETEALKSEGYAIGTQDGVEVTSGEYYQKNAKYYAEIANPPIENTVDFTDIITISDAINKAAKDVKLKVEAVQDLHGYNNPWVGGAGKNKLKITRTSGEVRGVTIINNGDTLILNGIATQAINPDVNSQIYLTDGDYKLSMGTSSLDAQIYGWNGSWVQLGHGTGDVAFTASSTYSYYMACMGMNNGQTLNNVKVYPMIRPSDTSTDFEPYTNICPISGWDNAKVTRAGKNLFDISKAANSRTTVDLSTNSATLTATGNYQGSGHITTKVKTGDYYTLSATVSTNAVFEVAFMDDSGNITRSGVNIIASYLPWTFHVDGDGTTVVRFTLANRTAGTGTYTFSNVQVEKGQTATAFEPYQGEELTISLNGTRYGGTLDVTSGVLNVTHGYVDLGTLDWSYNTSSSLAPYFYAVYQGIIKPQGNPSYNKVNAICSCYEVVSRSLLADGKLCCDGDNGGTAITQIQIKDTRYTDPAIFKTAITGQTLIYELATPATVQLTPTQVYLLYGYNTLFGDCGDISLTYDASGIIHIEESKLDTETLKTIAAASSDFADFKARIAAL